MYYNYKKTFSILLLAVCDANYRFTLVNIEEVGRRSDSGVCGTSGIGKATEEGKLNFPKPRVIPNYDTEVPLSNVFLADEELAPKPQMLRPYSQRTETYHVEEVVFNYRPSRTRRIKESSFGFLSARFRILKRLIIADIYLV